MKNFQTRCMIGLLVLLASCDTMTDKRVTFWRNDKIAYGTWYAYHSLPYMFPSAEISTSNVSPVNFYDGSDTNDVYLIVGKYVKPDEKELNAIINYANRGNHVFMSAAVFGDNLLDSFHLQATAFEPESYFGDSMTAAVRDREDHKWVSFAYPGFAIDNQVTAMDSSVGYILGINKKDKVNFVRFRYSTGGTVTFHFAPAAFTNFFLLHKDNKRYYDIALSTLPRSAKKIRWDDYYRHHTNGEDSAERNSFSKLSAFIRHPVLRWAFWLTIVLFALIYLFESKRKQRPVPVIAPLRNSSLDFVQTIGRLYLQRKDNTNLAQKMSANFLGHVRAHYNMGTSAINEDFEERLAFKSGHPIDKIKQLTGFIHQSETENSISDDALLTFGRLTDEFYKKT